MRWWFLIALVLMLGCPEGEPPNIQLKLCWGPYPPDNHYYCGPYCWNPGDCDASVSGPDAAQPDVGTPDAGEPPIFN